MNERTVIADCRIDEEEEWMVRRWNKSDVKMVVGRKEVDGRRQS